MPANYMLEIITPEREFYKGEVESVIIPTPDGQMSIQRMHEPMVAALGVGEMKLCIEGEWSVCTTSEGFVEVRPDETIIFSQAVEWPSEIDMKRAQEAKERAEERMRQEHSPPGIYAQPDFAGQSHGSPARRQRRTRTSTDDKERRFAAFVFYPKLAGVVYIHLLRSIHNGIDIDAARGKPPRMRHISSAAGLTRRFRRRARHRRAALHRCCPGHLTAFWQARATRTADRADRLPELCNRRFCPRCVRLTSANSKDSPRMSFKVVCRRIGRAT